MSHGTAFHVVYNTFSNYYLIARLLMLRSRAFGRVAPYMGTRDAILKWGLYVHAIGIYLSMLSVSRQPYG
jgi:hypothetical protein